MDSKNLKGIQFAFLTAFISGVSVFINKFAVGTIKPPLVFTTTKNIAVAVLIVVLLVGLGKLPQLKKLKRNEIMNLFAIGVVGGAIPFYLFFTGIVQTNALNAALIHKTLVIWVALLAIPFLKEKLTKMQAVGIALIFVSNLFVGGFTGFEFSKGEFFILLATLFWAVENVLAKKTLKSVDPDIVVGARMGIGAIVLLIASLIIAPKSFGQVATLTTMQLFWLGFTVLTLFGYVVTWYRALQLAPAITVSSVLVLATLITNILSTVFVTKTWDMSMLPQVAIISLGLMLYLKGEKQKSVATVEA